ncbi:MAG: hypothetical protein J6K74_08340 [Marinifilaceae bacterium]|nr:hypothetical protein [Marinifilaceae bacterium]
MQQDYVIIREYCLWSHIEPEFVSSLTDMGLLEPLQIGEESCLTISQARELQIYSHLYYDLSVNLEGIDVIRHLLNRLEGKK